MLVLSVSVIAGWVWCVNISRDFCSVQYDVLWIIFYLEVHGVKDCVWSLYSFLDHDSLQI